MESGAGIQVIIDLFQLIIKFLGRAAVLSQLVAIVLILLAAWYLTEPLVKWLGRLYGSWLANQRQRVTDEGTESVTEDVQVQSSLRIIRPLLQIAQQIAFPITAILLTSVTTLLFGRVGWFSGLLGDVLGMLGIFLAYRLFIGILYALFDEQKVCSYQDRFFRPLVAVIIILQIVGGLIELPILARASLFPLFGGILTMGSLFLATIGLYLWVVGTSFVKDVLQSVILKRTSADPGGVEATLILFRYVMIAAAVFVVFQLIGFNPTTLAAVLGGLSIGMGFALQDVLKNFLGGIILLFEGSIRPGDWVEVGGRAGKISSMSIRSTVVRTGDNVEYIVPNQAYLSSTIVAYTYTDPSMMIKVPISVSYDSNVREVQEVLIDVARHHPDIQLKPAPTAPLVGFGSGSINFELRGWVEDVIYTGVTEAGLRVMIVDALAEHNIVMASNQLDVLLLSELPDIAADSTSDDPNST